MERELLISLGVIVLVAGLTFFMRAFPFLLFGNGKKVPQSVETLGNLLPAAIIAILIVYCLKAIDLSSASHGLPEFIAVGLVAFLHVWKRDNLLSIGGGTLVYMFLVQFVFP